MEGKNAGHKKKEQFIVDNGLNGTVDLPGMKVQVLKGQYDVDLCEVTDKSVKELLSDGQLRFVLKKGWLIAKEKKNGKRIKFKDFKEFDLSKMLSKVDDYIESGKGTKATKPTQLVANYGVKPEIEVVDASKDQETEDDEVVEITKSDIDGLSYGDLLKKVSDLELSIDNNKKRTLISALYKFYNIGIDGGDA